MKSCRFISFVLVVWCVSVVAQDQEPDPSVQALTIEIEPAQLTIEVGDKATLVATVRDAAGETVEDVRVMFYSRSRRSVGVTRRGEVEAHYPGEFTIVALVPRDADDRSRRPDAATRVEVSVTVPHPPIQRLAFIDTPPKFYVGTRARLDVEVIDTLSTTRQDVVVAYASADPAVAEVDRFGWLTLHRPGTVELSARAEGEVDTLTIDVEANPVTALEVQSSAEVARTGDMIRFTRDGQGCAGVGRPRCAGSV